MIIRKTFSLCNDPPMDTTALLALVFLAPLLLLFAPFLTVAAVLYVSWVFAGSLLSEVSFPHSTVL
jgi:hypothetical protein